MLHNMPAGIERRRFTVDEYERMAESGVFAEDDRLELIEGEILSMSPPGSPHASTVSRATHAFVAGCGSHAIVRIRDPIRLSDFSEPQPDIVLARRRTDFYRSAHPRPADILLVVEIAHTTLRYDRHVKTPLYARNGIAEFWLVDPDAVTVTRHTSPSGDSYARVTMHGHGETLAPEALPDCQVRVGDLL
jgi:Uma2 family endonuclease